MSEEKQLNYWKSLNELAQNQEYQKFVEREFPENATELKDGVSRRGFLRVMGASIALAGFAACRRPVQKILPYSKQPEDIVPGIPLHYATAMPFLGNLTGLVVENHEGRPTKLEGNDLHPASLGGTNSFHQASILNLYDPDRSRSPRVLGEKASTDRFVGFVNDQFADPDQNIVFISEANSSLTFNRIKDDVLNKYPNAKWVTYEPFGEENTFEGTDLAFGQRLRPVINFENADVVVSLNDDFLDASHPNNVPYSKAVTAKRKITDTNQEMSRIYVVEDSFTVTGSYADHRLRLKPSEVAEFTTALAAELATRIDGLEIFEAYTNRFSDHKWINVLADELVANQGKSIVTLGLQYPGPHHAVVNLINLALSNVGSTVTFHQVPHVDGQNQFGELESAVQQMNSGNVDVAVIVGGNPLFNAPSVLNFEEALAKVGKSIHLSDYYDETSKATTWHVNRAHYLESWGDGYSFDGTRSVIQPQIQPLFGGISEIEFLNTILTREFSNGHELVKETWSGLYSSDFENRWNSILHDGVDTGGHFPAVDVRRNSNFSLAVVGIERPEGSIEISIRPDATIYDGRFANNGWLQELPDPMTKITWDNVALVSPNTALDLGVGNEDLISITVDSNTLELPVWVLPGHADGCITINAGQGRKQGRVAEGTGTNVFPLRSGSNLIITTASVSKAAGSYEIACVQDHFSLEGRDLYREGTVEEYRENPEFASFENVHTYEVPGLAEAQAMGEDEPISLFDEQKYPDYEPQWGMAIDLNSCFGCGACIVACQSENNIPVIGKREVRKGREMHWIRNDRYFVSEQGDSQEEILNDETIRAVHQPIPCMHCELAPCEQVCPVAATTHSDDGMNQMTYNRCIGTRYCANNCPYKVRRFNFFNYPKEYLTTGEDPEIIQMAMNPDVTVRFRGVMEKCTYCAQRVNEAKIQSKIDTGSPKPADGTVQTACQQACPADCIYFGDLTDENAEVTKMKRNSRNYQMLEELNTRPRTSYLAKLRNPNPALAEA